MNLVYLMLQVMSPKLSETLQRRVSFFKLSSGLEYASYIHLPDEIDPVQKWWNVFDAFESRKMGLFYSVLVEGLPVIIL